VIGISLPVLLARYFQGKPLYDKAVLLIKCFAAGVILSTSLVHVLPDAFDALSDCQVASQHPWKDYPFSGLVTLIGALTALLVDITATSHVEDGHGHGHSKSYVPVGTHDQENEKKLCGGELRNESVEMVVQVVNEQERVDEVVKQKQRLVSQVLEIGIIFHSVIIGVTMGMSQNQCTIRPLVAALAFHQIFEGMGLGGCIAQGSDSEIPLVLGLLQCQKHVIHGNGSTFLLLALAVGVGVGVGVGIQIRTPLVLVSVLSVNSCGSVFVLLGVVGLGFEEAGFSFGTTAYMCFMFSVTTPMGIVLGMILFTVTGYDDSSPKALIMEGLLGSFSSGISLPVLLARYFQGKPLYDKAVLLIKCFAAGVILSTSLVHVLPDAFDALSDCQVASQHPWKDYPFSGLVTLIGALTALLVDITATSHVEDGHGHGHSKSYVPVGTHDQENEKKLCGGELRNESVEMVVQVVNEQERVDEVVKQKQRLVSQVLEIGIIFHSVIIGVTMGMSQNQCTIRPLVAALAFHQIFEGMGLGGCIAQGSDSEIPLVLGLLQCQKHVIHGNGSTFLLLALAVGVGVGVGVGIQIRTPLVLVSVLSVNSCGSVFVLLGVVGLGFEEAGFSFGTTAYMCFMFSVTTPMGIVLGMILFTVTGYDDSSPKALIMEGLLGSFSSGILIYMGLVDLIAVDFFHNKMMTSNLWLKKASYIALILGSTSMSILALWA
ncbi:zinc transporter 6, partial [Quercus suber]